MDGDCEGDFVGPIDGRIDEVRAGGTKGVVLGVELGADDTAVGDEDGATLGLSPNNPMMSIQASSIHVIFVWF